MICNHGQRRNLRSKKATTIRIEGLFFKGKNHFIPAISIPEDVLKMLVCMNLMSNAYFISIINIVKKIN